MEDTMFGPSGASSKRLPGAILAPCLISFLPALCGCAAVEVKFGQRVYLAKIPATSIVASLPKGPRIAPGEKLPLVVTVIQPDGSVQLTEGEGHGKILWQDLSVTATVASVDKKGNVSLPADPRVSDRKTPHITVTAPSHPDLHAELDIPVHYDHAFAARFYGSPGYSGTDGSNGMDGSSGSSGSMDPDHPKPGGDGGNGADGSDGSNGERGGDGPPVLVRAVLRSGPHPLLQIRVSSQGKDSFFLVDPDGGSLTITSSGGPGGSGGHGGRGGRGGSGGTGSPDGSSGRDGSNGRDGSAGANGRDGSILVAYDRSAAPYLASIHLPVKGAPAPIYREQASGSLW
jgi:hypothetical protein